MMDNELPFTGLNIIELSDIEDDCIKDEDREYDDPDEEEWEHRYCGSYNEFLSEQYM